MEEDCTSEGKCPSSWISMRNSEGDENLTRVKSSRESGMPHRFLRAGWYRVCVAKPELGVIDHAWECWTVVRRTCKEYKIVSAKGPLSFRPAPKASPLRVWLEDQIGKGRSPCVLYECLLLESSRADLVAYLNCYHKPDGVPLILDRDQLKRWHRMWQDLRHFAQPVFDGLFSANTDGTSFWSCYQRLVRRGRRKRTPWTKQEAAKHINVLIAACPQEWEQGQQIAVIALEQALSCAHWRKCPPDDLPELDAVVDADPLPAWFFVKVLMPSFLRYGRTPAAILRGALDGDITALAQLYVLDSNATSIPGAAARLNEVMRGKGSWKWANAFKKASHFKSRVSTSVFAKVCQAATVIRSSRRICAVLPGLVTPLVCADLRDLYDASAQVHGRGLLCDEELPMGKSAFEGQVKRARDLLQFMDPDILVL